LRTTILATPIALACGAAHANIVIVQDVRQVRAQATASNPGGSDADGPNTAGPGGFGAPFNGGVSASALVSGAAAAASTVQISTFTPMQIRAQGSVSLSTSVLPGNSASAAGLSLVDILFDVPGGTQIEVISSRSGVGLVELRNAQDQLLFSGSGVYHAVLGGRLRLVASADAAYDAPPSGGDGGGYSLILNAVPGPSGAGVLAGACLFTWRRRR
jgi:hypothetical protein